MRTAARFVPMLRDFSRSFSEAPSFVRTAKMPMIDRTTPMAAISIGAMIARIWTSVPAWKNAEAPRAIVARMEPQ